MRLRELVVILSMPLAALAASGHRPVSDPGSGQELMLQQIQSESDEAKKSVLLEQFAERNPKHPALPWIYEQEIEVYSSLAQPEKVLRVCGPLLTLDADDYGAAHLCLKAAEAKKDTDSILKFSGLAWTGAHKAVIAAQAAGSTGSTDDLEFAKGVQAYSEYSVFILGYYATDVKSLGKFADILHHLNPDSTYLAQLTQQRFMAYMKAGEQTKAIALAEQALAANPNDDAMLLSIEKTYLGNKQFDKAIDLASKILASLAAKVKPDSMTDADWQAYKAKAAGRAFWIRGVAYGDQANWPAANQDLREALPVIRESDNKEMLAATLFYLGAASLGMADENDMVEFAQEGLKFSQECAEMPGQFQKDAQRNVVAIKQKYNLH